MKTAILADSVAYLPESIMVLPNVFTVNLSVNFPDGSTVEDSAINNVDEFYHKLATSKELPTTSQPSVGHFMEAFEQIIEEGYDSVIGILISSGLSGTYQSALSASIEYEDRLQIHLIDTLAASIVEDYLVEYAVEQLNHNQPLEEIVRDLEWFVEHQSIRLVVDTLTNLVKGGRLSQGAALLGNLLKIKPIITTDEEGHLVLAEKVRTEERVLRRHAEFIQEQLDKYPAGVDVWFAHVNCLEKVERIVEKLQAQFPQVNMEIRSLGFAIATHVGEGGHGFSVIPRIENRQ